MNDEPTREKKQPLRDREIFDCVVVGVGSAGAMVAARLTEDAKTSVLLLEAGAPANADEISVPAAFANLFETRCDWKRMEGFADGAVIGRVRAAAASVRSPGG